MENMETKVKTPKVQKISKNVANCKVNSINFLMFLNVTDVWPEREFQEMGSGILNNWFLMHIIASDALI